MPRDGRRAARRMLRGAAAGVNRRGGAAPSSMYAGHAMTERPAKKKLTDRWRDDPFPLYGMAAGTLILGLVAMVLLHGRAVEVVGTPLMFLSFVFLCASVWFGVSGYRRRTGRSHPR